jgi:hypothetical protein
VIEGAVEEGSLVAEGVVDAGDAHAHFDGRIFDRCGFEAELPEVQHGRIQHFVFVEFSGPCHVSRARVSTGVRHFRVKMVSG